MKSFDFGEIRRWYHLMNETDAPVEIRCIGKQGVKKVCVGYFNDATSICEALNNLPESNRYSIYATINPPVGEVMHTASAGRLVSGASSTADQQIDFRQWILIDIDTEKVVKDINATDEEKELAHKVAKSAVRYLSSQGFPMPVVIDSGNGYHLYYKIDTYNDDESRELIRNFLEALHMIVSTDDAHVDTSVFNAARIAKIPGTYSRKGADTEERPQRMAKILYVPTPVETVPASLISKIASIVPKREEITYRDRYSGKAEFNAEEWLNSNGISIARTIRMPNVTKYVLEECPFDHSHRDSAVTVFADGRIGFHCFHNSCSQYHWRDLRMKFEPYAYSQRDMAVHRQKTSFNNPMEVVTEVQPLGDEWLSIDQIPDPDFEHAKKIPTGYHKIDSEICGGLFCGHISVITGNNHSGKSTFIDTIALNAIQTGHKVCIWSAELNASMVRNWMMVTAAGEEYTHEVGNMREPKDIYKGRIEEWLKPSLRIFNNNHGTNEDKLISSILSSIENFGADLFIIDNLMSVSLSSDNASKYDDQKDFVMKLRDIARDRNIHIMLVAHPRKESGVVRKASISGSYNITDLASYVFILHRRNQDFMNGAETFWAKDEVVKMEQYDTIFEVCKDRAGIGYEGWQGLYYNPRAKRFECSRGEMLKYKWADYMTEGMVSNFESYMRQETRPNTKFENEIATEELPF